MKRKQINRKINKQSIFQQLNIFFKKLHGI